jgi:hypothetical protein
MDHSRCLKLAIRNYDVSTSHVYRATSQSIGDFGASDARWVLKTAWDPFLFIEWCDEARQAPGSDKEQAALKIQRAEWDLPFEWCAIEAAADSARSRLNEKFA